MSGEHASEYEIVEYEMKESKTFNPLEELNMARTRKEDKEAQRAELQRLNEIRDLERKLAALKK
jgi:hypothetical protein